MSQASPAEQRIRQFYELLNRGRFSQCFKMIDLHIRRSSHSVTRHQYEQSLRAFLAYYGKVVVRKVEVELHLGEPNKLYDGRDFAVGQTTWEDETGEQHVSQERWVRQGRTWYTRSTGFVAPSPETKKRAPKEALARPTGL